LFSDAFSTFILVIPNHIWLLAVAELGVNVFASIFSVTVRSLGSNNKFRHTFLYLCSGIFSPSCIILHLLDNGIHLQAIELSGNSH